MKKTYDKIFVTNLPAFYKLNLFNEIQKSINIAVVFTANDSIKRNRDFFKGEKAFDTYFFKRRNLLYRLIFPIVLLSKLSYKELIIGGWDSIPMWIFAILSPSRKNSIVVESSYYESTTSGLKGFIKRIFTILIRKYAYVSGKAQEQLIKNAGFKGEIITTKGVGVFNYIPQPPYQPKTQIKNFIYVGRFIEVKNLKFLITVFNTLPQYTLHIVGFGEQEDQLKSIAKSNIIFHGAINNKELPKFYQSCDIFILPSKYEAWGLVVEEALNNGLPVIISDRVGCGPEIVNQTNGLVFKHNSEEDLKEKISIISNIDYYNRLRKNISQLDFRSIEQAQIECYLHK